MVALPLTKTAPGLAPDAIQIILLPVAVFLHMDDEENDVSLLQTCDVSARLNGEKR